MLGRCCLCARQTEHALIASSRHTAPVASTSGHVFVRRRKRSSGSRGGSVRHFGGSTVYGQASESPMSSADASSSVPALRSLWKGKAKAVQHFDDSPAKETYTLRPNVSISSQQPKSMQATSQEADPITDSDSQIDTSKEHLQRAVERGDAVSAIFVLANRALHDISSGIPVNTPLLLKSLEEITQSCRSPAIASRLETFIASIQQESDTQSHHIELLVLALLECILRQRNYKSRHLQFRKLLLRTRDAFEGTDGDRFQTLCNEVMHCSWKHAAPNTTLRFGQDIYRLLGDWTPQTLKITVLAAISGEQPHLAPRIRNIESISQSLPLSTFNLLVRAHLLNRDLAAAREILAYLAQRDIELDQSTYRAIFEGNRALGHNDSLNHRLRADLESLGVPLTAETVNMLIEMEIDQGNMAAAHTYLELFEQPLKLASPTAEPLAIPPSDTDIGQALEPADGSTTKELSPSMTSAGTLLQSDELQPDSTTFALFVKGYNKMGRFEEALDFYRDMVEIGYKPAPFLVSAIMRAHASVNLSTALAPWIDPADKPPADPRVDLASAVSLSFRETTEAKDASAGEQTRTAKRHRDKFHQAMAVNAMKTQGLNAFAEVIRSMTAEGMTIDAPLINTFLAQLDKSDLVGSERLASLISNLRKIDGCTLNQATLNILLRAVLRRQRQKQFSKTFNKHRREVLESSLDVQVSESADTAVLSSLAGQLASVGINPDGYTAAILMQHFADESGSPAQLWDFFKDQVLNRGLKPAPHHISALMTAYVNDGDRTGARRAMERGATLGVPANVVHWTILIVDALRRQRFAAAHELAMEMRETGIKPDYQLLAAFAAAAATRGNVKTVSELSRQARQMFPDLPVAPVALQTSMYQARQKRHEPISALEELEYAFDNDLEPDRRLRRVIRRSAKDTRRRLASLPLRDEPTLSRTGEDDRLLDTRRQDLEAALERIQAVQDRMARSFGPSRIVHNPDPTRQATKAEISETMNAIEANIAASDVA